MSWFSALFQGETVASSVTILGVVIALGLAIGSIKIKSIGLGIAGVLFSGLLMGHLGLKINPEVLEFAREFGLILFVYTIGMQVGPGFLASLRRQGLPLNLMAIAIVLLGAAIAVGIHYSAGVEIPAVVGLFSGGTTNTPSLAAAQQALKDVPNLAVETSKLPSLAYAVAYPFGILGIILAMLLVRVVFRVNLTKEEQALGGQTPAAKPRVARANLEVTNRNLVDVQIQNVPLISGSGLVISRILQDGILSVPQPETRLKFGDVLLAVGSPEELDKLRMVVGCESDTDLRMLASPLTTKRLVVTRKNVLGKSLDELDFVRRYGVVLSRVSRAEIEFTPTHDFRVQYGDTFLAVGEAPAISKVAQELGDSPKALNHPQLIPVFLGIVLGVIVGSVPMSLPGVPAPVKLGLAGGPLLVAIILSRVGRIGPLVWHMPISANFMLREVGITLFLGCVGLRSGDRFISTLTEGPGLQWMALAAMITLVPLLVVALVGRIFLKTNYMTLCGLLAGSMTDPPALSFAQNITRSDAPNLAYATVYPTTMILRVLCAQLMVIALMPH
ncbi:MAG: putative transporter [Phycisphaeraceae bacterium]|nr:putative transporter [Phycisphaeraceae bacterium]